MFIELVNSVMQTLVCKIPTVEMIAIIIIISLTERNVINV